MCVNALASVNIYNSFKYVFKYTFFMIIVCSMFSLLLNTVFFIHKIILTPFL